MSACFDSDIVIDYLQGRPEAEAELAQFNRHYISTVTWSEVMTGAIRGGIEIEVRGLLRNFWVHDVDTAVAELAAQIRNRFRMRTPDALVWATAIGQGLILVTRNTKDFPADDSTIRIPYRL